jgi:PHP-associated
MTRFIRLGGLGLWFAGLLIGTLGDRVDPSASTFADGYRVVAADFHVHSYPGDGVLPPWELAHEARRRGLDAIALTNHNQMLPARLASVMPFAPEILLIPSEEITAPGYHLAAVGIARTISWRHTVADAASEIHAQGGVAIAAHPLRIFWRAFGDAALRAVDGVEVAHPGMDFQRHYRDDYPEFFARARAVHPGVAPIGSSDYHDFAPVGRYRTYLFVRELTREGIVDAIHAGRTVACDAHGRTSGDPRLAAAVRPSCEQAAASASSPTPLVDRAAMACALIGLLIVIVV